MVNLSTKKTEIKKKIETLCPDTDGSDLEEYFQGMDPEYFSLYSPEDISRHFKMVSSVNSQNLLACRILNNGPQDFNIEIVAYDYLSVFSILCGQLASFGLDIQTGHIYTLTPPEKAPVLYRRGRQRKTLSKRKIVDIFNVRLLEGEVFDKPRQEAFQKELSELFSLMDQGELQEARRRVSQRVAALFSRSREDPKGRRYPVHIKFNNRISKKWTVMEIQAKDTVAFLYSFSSSLSLRGIYIHKVFIEKKGPDAHDIVYLSDIRGNKIEKEKELEYLKVAVVMIKQFTPYLGHAPNPFRALRYFDQMLDKVMDPRWSKSGLAFLRNREGLDLMARLLGTSQFLWEDFLRMQFENLFPVVRNFNKKELWRKKENIKKDLKNKLKKARSSEEKKIILNLFKDQEMFRIDMKHLLEPPEDLMEFSRALTELAEVVLEQAADVCLKTLRRRYGIPLLDDGSPCPFAICGLGKFGGREMGYASDIEVLFIYGGEGKTKGKHSIENRGFFDSVVQEILNVIEAKREGIFRLDLRLRPFGNAGSLATPLDLFKRYYHVKGGAAPFERQALTKLRWVAGDRNLGRAVEAHRDAFVYQDHPWELATAQHLRCRQMNELARPGTVNVKYGRGGVIDIEYAVQYLQVMHGWKFEELRTPSTLEALDGLVKVRLISPAERDDLKNAYLFLRALIDALRMVRGNAQDLILPGLHTDDFQVLARRLGYTGSHWKESAEKLNADIHRHMNRAHQFFEDRFGNG